MSELIFDIGRAGRRANAQMPQSMPAIAGIPEVSLRKTAARLPEVSELQAVRHYTRLSQKNFSIDTQFYPLGSCTMKYNPRGAHRLASMPGFLSRHPLADVSVSQGYLQCMLELQDMLKDVTGMETVSLTPMAGAQGEFAGVAMIRAYHDARGDSARTEMLIPDAAHGTNPASAAQSGFTVKEVKTGADGDLDIDALRAAVGPQTAGIMLTNPSTLGVFERQIELIASIVHEAGGLLYYDGANLNAILGKVRPGDMGFDVVHLNLHKTFATPHGGGGPGSGPVAAGARLAPYIPTPVVVKEGDAYRWSAPTEYPDSIGRLSAFMGNAGILLRAYIYARMLGREGMHRAAEFAVLNANYLKAKLSQAGFTLAYPNRVATHEFVITMTPQAKNFKVSALDLAKRLLDYGFHAPTMYFPLLVPECLLIEPTETESKETLDAFVDAMVAILREIESEPEKVTAAPSKLALNRLDEVKAAKALDVVYMQGE